MGFLKLFLITATISVAAYYYLNCYSCSFKPDTLKGKYVVVTGASTGIGEQLAYKYATYGAKLLITARRENVLKNVAEKCKSLGSPQVEIVAADMGVQADRAKVVQAVKTKFGALDQLILNHAYIPINVWKNTNSDLDELKKGFEVNVFANIEIVSAILPLLEKSKGSICVVSSVAGKVSTPKMSIYTANKFALQGFFGSLRQDLRLQNIDVSVTLAVLGLIGTDQAFENMNKIAPKNYDPTLQAASPEETALATIKGVTARQPEIYYPILARIMVWIHKFLPNVMENYIGDSMELN